MRCHVGVTDNPHRAADAFDFRFLSSPSHRFQGPRRPVGLRGSEGSWFSGTRQAPRPWVKAKSNGLPSLSVPSASHSVTAFAKPGVLDGPGPPAVDGGHDAEIGSEIETVRVFGIDDDRVHWNVRYGGAAGAVDRLPGFAVVAATARRGARRILHRWRRRRPAMTDRMPETKQTRLRG